MMTDSTTGSAILADLLADTHQRIEAAQATIAADGLVDLDGLLERIALICQTAETTPGCEASGLEALLTSLTALDATVRRGLDAAGRLSPKPDAGHATRQYRKGR
jgi:hypothetical protein